MPRKVIHTSMISGSFSAQSPVEYPRFLAIMAYTVISAGVLALIVVGAVSIVRQQIDIGATDEELFDIPTAFILSVLPLGLTIAIMHLLVEIYVIWQPAKTHAP